MTKWQKGPKTMQKTEINQEKPQIDKALPSRVASSVVKESILWLGFKRPSTYWVEREMNNVQQAYISKFQRLEWFIP